MAPHDVPSDAGGSAAVLSNAGGGSTCLADFKQLARLGEGAFSVVYKVQRLADKGIYALKMVKLPSLKEKEKQNALNEVRLLASVNNEYIIAYKEAFFDEKFRCLCIVTEYADKGDLFQQISKCQKEKTRMPENVCWRYLWGMCLGLKALHDKKILHRDLKCANVFLGNSPQGLVAKLGDFNVSKVAKRGLCVTQTGTPYYASPEVWRDMPYDAKSDMWSIGCVLYEMLALRPPFQAEDMEGLYRKVLRGQYPRIPSQYSNDMGEVVAMLLQVNPRHRPSVDQLLQMPQCARHNPTAGGVIPDGNVDLLQTIKLPSNAIDLSGCLPKPRYDLPMQPLREEEDGVDGASEAGGGRRPNPGPRARSGREPSSEQGGYNPGQQAPLQPSAPPSSVAPVADSLDTYMQQPQRQQQPQPQQIPAQQLQQRQADRDSGDESALGVGARSGRQVRQHRQGGYRNTSGQRPQYGAELAPPPSDRGLHSASDVSSASPSRIQPLAQHPRQDMAPQRQQRPLAQSRSQAAAAPQKPPSSHAEQQPASRNRGLRLPRIFG